MILELGVRCIPGEALCLHDLRSCRVCHTILPASNLCLCMQITLLDGLLVVLVTFAPAVRSTPANVGNSALVAVLEI